MRRKPTESASDTNVYLFTGEVDLRRESAVEQLIAMYLDSSFSMFDMERFDGGETKATEILSAASNNPFGSERKVVIVDRVDRLSPADQEKIAAYIPKLGDRSCLILLTDEDSRQKRASQVSKDSDGDGSSSKLVSGLSSAVKARGRVTNFAKLRIDDVAGLVSSAVRVRGKKIEPSALQLLARAVALNPASIPKEVDKLEAYTAGRDTIMPADVEEVVSISPEDRVFPLIDAAAAGRAETAVRLLEQTLAASTKPDREVLKILSLLARHFRLLYQVKYMMMQSRSANLSSASGEIQAVLMQEKNPMSVADWQKGKLIEQAREFTESELRRCLKLILKCELDVKGLGSETGSPRLNLDMLVVKLSRRKPGGR